jgi:hypothetical protein
MKNKLILFGDSFTFGVGCNPEHEYYKKYKKEDDKTWFNIVADELNLEVINHGEGLFSNDKIFDSILNSYDEINEGDYVLIEKGFTHRFDIPNLDDTYLVTIAPNCKNLLTNDFTLSNQNYSEWEIQAIEYMVLTFDSKLIRQRFDKRFQFIKKIIDEKKVKKCLIWNITDYMNWTNYPIIFEETNGEINDCHWSFKGHKNVAHEILKQLKNNE